MKATDNKKHQDDRINIFSLFASVPTFIYLLPLPVLQNLLFDPNGFWEHLTSYSLSIIIFIAASIFFAADYNAKRCRVCCDKAIIKEGIFIRSTFSIPYDRLQSVIIQRSPIAMLFSAVKIQLNTAATKAKKGDAVFYLSSRRAKRLIREIYEDIGSISKKYRAKNFRIFFMSAIWSNPISGFIILLPIINSSGKIVGERLQSDLLSSVDFSEYLVYVGISPAFAFITYFLLICYGVGVLADFLRTAGFSCTSCRNGLIIERGIIRRTIFFTNEQKLNAITINQSLFMIPLRLYSAYIYTVGSGKVKGDKSLLIAAEKNSKVKAVLTGLFSKLDLGVDFTVKPSSGAVWLYLRVPLVTLSLNIACVALSYKLYVINSIILYLSIFSIPALIIWCLFCLKAFKASAISVNDKYIYVNSFRRITLRSTVIPLNKIQFCVKRTNIFQRRSATCNIRIYIYGEKRTFVEVKHLSETDADKIITVITK